MKKKGWLEILLKWLGLIQYKTVHHDHVITIKRPENDCKLYQDKDIEEILRLKGLDKTDEQIGLILKRTEGAIRMARWRFRHGS